MMHTLVVSTAAAFVAAGVFAYVGYALGRRVVTTPEARAAFTCFRVWWYATAAMTLLAAVRSALYLADLLPTWAYQATAHVMVMVTAVALWALLCNLVYLYTGSIRFWGFLAVGYFLVAVLFVGLLSWTGPPLAVTDDGWSLQATTANVPPRSVQLAALAVLALPQLVAAILYLRLFGHAPGRTQRYRIVLVGSSIVLWFGSTVLASLLEPLGGWNEMLTRTIGIVAAILVLLAYDPPGALQRRLGVVRAGEEGPGPGAPEAAAKSA